MSLAFQFEAFLTTRHQYTKFIDGNVKNIIRQLTNQKASNSKPFNPRLFQVSQKIQKKQRVRSRASSVEIPFYLLNWAINKSVFKTAITKFKAVTKNVHIEENDRSSTGNTFTNKPLFSRLLIISVDDFVKTFTIFSLSDASFQNSFTSESSKRLFRKMYPPRDDRPLFFPDFHLSPNMFSINEDVIRKMITQVFAEVRQEPGPPGPPGFPGSLGAAGNGNGTERFIPQDVGFFDPFYDGKSIDTGSAMEHAGKDIYFRDVHAFIDRIINVTSTKNDVVCQNMRLCLRGSVLKWYISEFTDGEKRFLTYGNGVKKWTTLFRARFKTSRSTGMAIMLKEKYTMNDAAKRREPRKYARTVIRTVKTAELGDTTDHLLIVWNGLNIEFQRDIVEPDKTTTLNGFFLTNESINGGHKLLKRNHNNITSNQLLGNED